MIRRRIIYECCLPRQIITVYNYRHIHFKFTHKSPLQNSYFDNLIFKSLRNLESLRQLHAHLITSGASHSLFLSNNLISSYISFGNISRAHIIFDKIPHKNIFSWTILISGFTKRGHFYQALNAFRDLIESGLKPNEFTLSTILPVFANLGLELLAKSVHCYWVRNGFERNVVVETGLVDLYARLGCMSNAHSLFDKMPDRNVVSWNVLISGYASNGKASEAVRIFNLMRMSGVCLDSSTIMSLISGVFNSSLGSTTAAVHGLIRIGNNNEQQIQTALISIYTACDSIYEAYVVFREILVKDVVAWTQMLEGLSSGGYWSMAIEHFSEMMRVHCLALDSTAIVSILSSCSSSGALLHGKRVHALIVKRGFNSDGFVGSALIDMYANCGYLESGKRFFDAAEVKDVVSWNAMIKAVGANGNGGDAIDLLWRMEALGLNPNESTIVSVLSGCSHACMVDEGLRIFNHLTDRWGIVPTVQHYACIVDLLGRSGRLNEAHSVIDKMPFQPTIEVYGALLSGCKVYGNTKMAAEIFQRLLKLDIIDVGHICSVSNMYASVGNWEKISTFNKVLPMGVKRDPGYSLA